MWSALTMLMYISFDILVKQRETEAENLTKEFGKELAWAFGKITT
jgi:hypothetical protein